MQENLAFGVEVMHSDSSMGGDGVCVGREITAHRRIKRKMEADLARKIRLSTVNEETLVFSHLDLLTYS